MTTPRVLFASYHCYHDPTSGAAVCTRDLFAVLSARGWACSAFTGPHLDDPFAPPIAISLRDRPGVRAVARAAGARVVFWLHNFGYKDKAAFAGCDAVVVPSEYSRKHYQEKVGVECVVLPPVIDSNRVVVERPDGGRFVTFVNPEPGKGVFWFARIAEVLGRTRPDIPFLVVEGRGRTDWLAKAGIDWTGITTVHRMANTPDPKAFYRLSRLVLVPSVAPESFGLVAAEAILNGIPVIASDRGALPEAVGSGGECLPIPGSVTPESRLPPSADEVRPWVEAVRQLWDTQASPATLPPCRSDAVGQWEQFLGR